MHFPSFQRTRAQVQSDHHAFAVGKIAYEATQRALEAP
jgi:hypothetical protein